jgi:hypothetical protein
MGTGFQHDPAELGEQAQELPFLEAVGIRDGVEGGGGDICGAVGIDRGEGDIEACESRAQAPFTPMTPEPRSPGMTYVSKRAALSQSATSTFSLGRIPLASSRSRSIVIDPT